MKFCKRRCILFIILKYASRIIGENVRKISKNGNLKTQIYEANDSGGRGVRGYSEQGLF